jgi:hypothetical protein
VASTVQPTWIGGKHPVIISYHPNYFPVFYRNPITYQLVQDFATILSIKELTNSMAHSLAAPSHLKCWQQKLFFPSDQPLLRFLSRTNLVARP